MGSCLGGLVSWDGCPKTAQRKGIRRETGRSTATRAVGVSPKPVIGEAAPGPRLQPRQDPIESDRYSFAELPLDRALCAGRWPMATGSGLPFSREKRLVNHLGGVS